MNELAKVLERASRPFAPEEVEFTVKATSRDRRKALMVAHLTARSVMDRLAELVKEGLLESWTADFEVVERGVIKVRTRDGEKEEPFYAVVARIRLTLPSGKVLVKEDVGEGDTLKGAFSDALKRAAVHLGVGRYLYRLGEMWAELPEGRDYPSEEEIRKLRQRLRSLTRQEERQAQAPPAQDPLEDLRRRLRQADEMISKLIEELKAQGKGVEAARAVTNAGYRLGEPPEGSPEELRRRLEAARGLYKALQELKG